MVEFKGSHFERDVVLWGVRVLFGRFAATFGAARRPMRSTRFTLTTQPAAFSNAVIRR